MGIISVGPTTTIGVSGATIGEVIGVWAIGTRILIFFAALHGSSRVVTIEDRRLWKKTF
jgi:hypothetical protein